MKLAQRLPEFHDGKRVARTPKERRIARRLAREREPDLRLRRSVFLYVDGTQPLIARLMSLTARAYAGRIAQSILSPNPLLRRLMA